eukprot:2701449-Prymnesium_polylepis.1
MITSLRTLRATSRRPPSADASSPTPSDCNSASSQSPPIHVQRVGHLGRGLIGGSKALTSRSTYTPRPLRMKEGVPPVSGPLPTGPR